MKELEIPCIYSDPTWKARAAWKHPRLEFTVRDEDSAQNYDWHGDQEGQGEVSGGDDDLSFIRNLRRVCEIDHAQISNTPLSK